MSTIENNTMITDTELYDELKQNEWANNDDNWADSLEKPDWVDDYDNLQEYSIKDSENKQDEIDAKFDEYLDELNNCSDYKERLKTRAKILKDQDIREIYGINNEKQLEDAANLHQQNKYKTDDDRCYEGIDYFSDIEENPEFLINYLLGLISVGILYGSSSLGKSSFLYKLAKLVAISGYKNDSWNDLEINHGKVLIYQLEESKSITRKRFTDVLDNPGFNNIIFGNKDWTLGKISQLRKDIEIYRPKLVIIDSLSKANYGHGGDPTKPEYANFIFDLQKIVQDFKCLILINHHTTKDGEKFAGTPKLMDNSDFVIRFKKHENDPDVRLLAIEKDRLFDNQDVVYQLRLDKQNNDWIYEGELETSETEVKNKSNQKQEKQDNKDILLKAIANANDDGGINKKDLEKLFPNVISKTVSNYLRELETEGKIYEAGKKHFIVKQTVDVGATIDVPAICQGKDDEV